ncbi:class I SAM-dependent methyltransferase [Frondihabitans cladoniiphilus]|uniref:Class I SAM-dependent methyltransferase n=1 Tax=Frondihabitans cladoniiphilus TaxID=715785 RepID=A0ABP8VSU1_9MICO
MSLVVDWSAPREASFGSGGAEPYAHALRRNGALTLVGDGRRSTAPAAPYDLSQWMAAADVVDRSVLHGERGPVLDIGCGPGRMIRAAADLGFTALGVDVSAAAAQVARDAGLPVLAQSIFEPMPWEGLWGTLLLLDGNIGIGGDPAALLGRCRELLRDGGAVLVEVQDDPSVDDAFTAHVVDDRGGSSAGFPWAEVGRDALGRHAASAGLAVSRTWRVAERSFCRLTPAASR